MSVNEISDIGVYILLQFHSQCYITFMCWCFSLIYTVKVLHLHICISGLEERLLTGKIKLMNPEHCSIKYGEQPITALLISLFYHL